MRGSIYKKGLVVGIIILFLGLSIQSSVGIEITINKNNEIKEDEEDCISCYTRKLPLNENTLDILRLELSNIDKIKEGNPDMNITCNILYNIYLTRLYQLFFYIGLHVIVLNTFPNMAKYLEDYIDNTLHPKIGAICYAYEEIYNCDVVWDIPYCGNYEENLELILQNQINPITSKV